ncbi:hypothetical protein [Xenorhabdus bovienii]|uniref:hypothetical protein n=1 Tax=Xenorhabdus bovienii TaxID=40576 RepID=UPI003DA6687E
MIESSTLRSSKKGQIFYEVHSRLEKLPWKSGTIEELTNHVYEITCSYPDEKSVAMISLFALLIGIRDKNTPEDIIFKYEVIAVALIEKSESEYIKKTNLH